MSRSIKISVAAASMAALLWAGAAPAAQTFKIQTSFNAGDVAYQYLIDTWVPKLKETTNGEVSVELLPTGSVVPHRETPEAVAAGILGGDLTSIAYFSGRDPAFAVLGDLIAGYDTPAQQIGFCREGGGEEILQKAFDKILPNKLHVVGCGPYSREALVASVPIRGVADLQGLKIRAPEGLASDVFRRAGATPVSLPYSEVFTAIQLGTVSAADASAYVNNDAAGMHKIAKHPLYPGIHSQPVLQFTLNAAKWKALSEEQRTALHEWFYSAMEDLTQVVDEKDAELAARDAAAGEIEVIDWPQEERDKFREIAKEAWEAFAAKSPLAQEALDANLKYMKDIGLLKE